MTRIRNAIQVPRSCMSPANCMNFAGERFHAECAARRSKSKTQLLSASLRTPREIVPLFVGAAGATRLLKYNPRRYARHHHAGTEGCEGGSSFCVDRRGE